MQSSEWTPIFKELWDTFAKPKPQMGSVAHAWFPELKDYSEEDVHQAMKKLKFSAKFPTLEEFRKEVLLAYKPAKNEQEKRDNEKYHAEKELEQEEKKIKCVEKIQKTQPDFFDQLKSAAIVKDVELFENHEQLRKMYSGKTLELIEKNSIYPSEMIAIFDEFEKVRG